jgi:putative photosynthetic complex assembly protein 2
MDSPQILQPILYVLLAWWLSTGIILYLDQRPVSTYFSSFSATTAVAIGALMMLAISSQQATTVNAYVSFSAALLVWGWHEMAFLMGYITGSRKLPIREGGSEFQRFLNATEAILYHEVVLAVTAAILFIASWEQPNQVGAYTFFILWVMRLSAKLNLFLGVRNRYESFLPAQLRYLESYFGKRSINLLFPVVVTASTAAAILLWQHAVAPSTNAFEASSLALLATLLTLAVIEHWFLIVPLPVERMWAWALRARGAN